MTEQQKDWLLQIGQTIKKVIPNFYGSIRFNIRPDKGGDVVNINIEQSLLLTDNKPKK